MANTWIYVRSEPQLWTVGCTVNGRWHTDTDWPTKEEAAKRAHWLNGLAHAQEDLATALVLLHAVYRAYQFGDTLDEQQELQVKMALQDWEFSQANLTKGD